MRWMKILGPTAALAAVLAVAPPAPAHADDPAAGSSCDSGQLNLTTKSSAGEGLRCLADGARGYVWQKDTGVTQTPDDAARIAHDACQHVAAACDSIRDHVPHR